jgi:predicted 2-oxoglutarate/Fe(II)-dependent dioxygenase YbiX
MYVGKPIEPTAIYAGCVAEYENIWPDSKKIIAQIEKETKDAQENQGTFFQPALTHGDIATNNTIQRVRTNSLLPIKQAAAENEFFRTLNNKYFFTILDAVASYKEMFEITEDLQHVEGYDLLKYQTGQEYKAHYDGGSQVGRAVSPILYLNDNYTGGEIEFVNHNVKIKPKAGSLYLFPATFAYRHIAHPVTSGTKYAIVTFLHDTIV